MTTATARTMVAQLLNEAKRLVKYEDTAANDARPTKNGFTCWWIWDPCAIGGSVAIELSAEFDNFSLANSDTWCRPKMLAIVHRFNGNRVVRLESDQGGDRRIDHTRRPKQHLSYLLNRLSPDNVRVIET